MTRVLVAGKDLRIELRSRVVLQPGGALRRPRPRPLRLRPRARPRVPWSRPRRAVLGGRALRHRARRPAQLRPRVRRRARATACACRGSTRPASSWARRRPCRPAGRPRGGADRRAWSCSSASHVRSYGSAGRRRPRRATVGLAAAGTLYGALVGRVAGPRDAAALPVPPGGRPRCCWPGPGRGRSPWDRPAPAGDAGDPWLRLLLVFAAVYLALGIVLFGPAPGGVMTTTDRRSRPGPAPATWVVRRPRHRRRGGVADGLARAVGDPARPGPAQPGPPRLRPPAHRLGGAVPRLRPGRGVERPVAVAPDAEPCSGTAWPRPRSRWAPSSRALTLVTGSIWGRPTWGVWWAWDARLTSTALLLVLLLGYLALRRVPADPDVRARRCAVAALVAAVDVPIVHFSVDWWHTLHQGATVLNAEPLAHDPRLDGLDAAARLRRLHPVSPGWSPSATGSRSCATGRRRGARGAPWPSAGPRGRGGHRRGRAGRPPCPARPGGRR